MEMKGKTVQNAVRNGLTTLTFIHNFFLHISFLELNEASSTIAEMISVLLRKIPCSIY